ncbi:MAG: alpha-L-fucosidase [Verrucomicrobia bacterium]|nr:alpha-L-fucosidase [Verrucomicrobiota bacterium]MBT7065627.1 alpha-L-fucosidase [Verrucomicrobiota bacterium]MBT7699798.1 alpha-L-fucosidase [Verrucomicrobiota bacterium]
MDAMWGDPDVSVDALKEGRGKLFAEGNYGMFVHWGLYSHLGGVWQGRTYYGIGEWLMHPQMANIPIEEYRAVAKEFCPDRFDANAIAQLALDAGMKYIIITSKHHEGFAMFKSEASPFNIVDATPFGRDPMLELSRACRERGLGFGFYYSHYQDWETPGGAGTRAPSIGDADRDEAPFEDYFYSKCKPQVEEICTNYGEIDFVWFDTPGRMQRELVVELAQTVRRLQPNAMLCSRIGHGMGDYASKGDMEVPLENIEGLWETCDTNNDSWSYAWYDRNFKSPTEILQRLIATIGRGGTYLLNVGPDGRGMLPEMGAGFLERAGAWIRTYPQVIYKAGTSPWGRALPWGDCTTQGHSLFLCVYDWPRDGNLHLFGLDDTIVSAQLLHGCDKEPIPHRTAEGWTTFTVPYQPADSLISVIELKLEGDAGMASVSPELGICPNADATLPVDFATVAGATRTGDTWMEKFGEWKHVTQASEWKEGGKTMWQVNVRQPGFYKLSLVYAGTGRLVWRVETDEEACLQNQQAATEKYVAYPMGVLEFRSAGPHTITAALVEGDATSSRLQAVELHPVTLH